MASPLNQKSTFIFAFISLSLMMFPACGKEQKSERSGSNQDEASVHSSDANSENPDEMISFGAIARFFSVPMNVVSWGVMVPFTESNPLSISNRRAANTLAFSAVYNGTDLKAPTAKCYQVKMKIALPNDVDNCAAASYKFGNESTLRVINQKVRGPDGYQNIGIFRLPANTTAIKVSVSNSSCTGKKVQAGPLLFTQQSCN